MNEAIIALTPDYDYRDSIIYEVEEDQLTKFKTVAANVIAARETEDGDVTDRVVLLTQLLTVMRIELPRYVKRKYEVDDSTALIFIQELVDRMFIAVTGFAPSWTQFYHAPDFQKFPRNRSLLMFSTRLLYIFNEVLCTPEIFVDVEHDLAGANTLNMFDEIVLRLSNLFKDVVTALAEDEDVFDMDDLFVNAKARIHAARMMDMFGSL